MQWPSIKQGVGSAPGVQRQIPGGLLGLCPRQPKHLLQFFRNQSGFLDKLIHWIGPTNCQQKWLGTWSAEIWHEEKYFDCWSNHAARWIVNETTWKTVPKPPKSVYWKPNRGNLSFRFLNFEVSSVRFLEHGLWTVSIHYLYIFSRKVLRPNPLMATVCVRVLWP